MEFDDVKLGVSIRCAFQWFYHYVKKAWPSIDEGVTTTVDVTRKLSRNFDRNAKVKMTQFHKLMFEFIHECIFPRSKKIHEATILDMEIIELFDVGKPINLQGLMINHMARVVDTNKAGHAALWISTDYIF